MGFTSKRGRPSLKLVEGGKKEDAPEQKPVRPTIKIAREPLDICHAKGLISDKHHWCGVHFRWLYTVRFGSPDISAMNIETYAGASLKRNDEGWQEFREKEYAMAIEALRKTGALKTVMNVTVFNFAPRFLTGVRGHTRRQMELNYREISKLKEGLDALAGLWCK